MVSHFCRSRRQTAEPEPAGRRSRGRALAQDVAVFGAVMLVVLGRVRNPHGCRLRRPAARPTVVEDTAGSVPAVANVSPSPSVLSAWLFERAVGSAGSRPPWSRWRARGQRPVIRPAVRRPARRPRRRSTPQRARTTVPRSPGPARPARCCGATPGSWRRSRCGWGRGALSRGAPGPPLPRWPSTSGRRETASRPTATGRSAPRPPGCCSPSTWPVARAPRSRLSEDGASGLGRRRLRLLRRLGVPPGVGPEPLHPDLDRPQRPPGRDLPDPELSGPGALRLDLGHVPGAERPWAAVSARPERHLRVGRARALPGGRLRAR
jgi:hypothetical protein